jgi:DNA-binding transcriptional LysR family regulator
MSLHDVTRLRIFALVCDLGSVSAAATILGYTQSAVSQQLAALEREVGTALVDRSRRPFHPTPAGRALRPDIDRVLEACTAADATLAGLRAGITRRLRLASFPSGLASLVPGALRQLRREYPDLGVQVLQHETREALGLLTSGGADLAVVHHLPTVPLAALTGVDRHVLLRDELCVVLPRHHRLARTAAVHLTDLASEPLLVPRRDTAAGPFRSLVEHLCAEHGFAPHVAYEVDDHAGAQAFAAAGVAVVLMHRMIVATPRPGVVVRPLANLAAGCRIIEAATPAEGCSPAARALLGYLSQAAREYESQLTASSQ